MTADLSPLISAAELAELTGLTEQEPVLLDVRWQLGGPPGVAAYQAGHLPGARYVDLDRDLAGPPGAAGRHPLPDPASFERAMRGCGLSAGQLAVVYDDAGATIAARLWWMLRYYGHPRVRVLDGGYQAWLAAGFPVTTQPPEVTAGDFAVRGTRPEMMTDAEGAARLAAAGRLLDARAGERYRGEVEPVDQRAGHIPGALSAPTKDNLGPGGVFLAPSELKDRFAALGLPAAGGVPGADAGAQPAVGAYCGSGVTAAHEVLALELAGLPAALYVGSWSEWSANPARPVATGPTS